MGRPSRGACGDCDWYIRGHSYDGPLGFGGCFKKKRWTSANQTVCDDDFENGHPCLSLREAELKWEVRELKEFINGLEGNNSEMVKAVNRFIDGQNDDR